MLDSRRFPGLPWFIGNITFDHILPKALERLSTVVDALLPLSREQIAEGSFHLGSNYIPVDSKSEACRNHSAVLFSSFLNGDIWALKMVDASSKISSGLLDGHLMDLGSYDECLSVEEPHGLFTGQHCVVETRGLLPPEIDTFNTNETFFRFLRIDVVISLCVPSSCSPDDVSTHLDLSLNAVNASSIVYESSCSSSASLPLRTADYVAGFVLCLLTTLTILGTIFDYVSKKADTSWLRCFSLRCSARSLLAAPPPHILPCLDGIRVLVTAWVVLGHQGLHLLTSPISNFIKFEQIVSSASWVPLTQVWLTIEVFLLMSGTLLTYNFLRDRHNDKQFSYVRFCLRRYFRLTPTLAVVVLLYGTLLVRITDGPVWRRMFVENQENCKRNWWSTLLYVNNYANYDSLCLYQSWYLSADYQFHVLSPLLLLPLWKSARRGHLYITVAFLATTASSLATSYWFHLPATGLLKMDRRYEHNIVREYMASHNRAASFLMGIALGHLLFKVKQEELTIKLDKVQVWLGWVASTGLALGSVFSIVIFGDPEYENNPWVDPVFRSLHRPVFALTTAWTVLACTTDHAGLVSNFLSWKGFVPLSRLTYCTFLLHYYVQDVHMFRTRSSIQYDLFSLWSAFISDVVVSFALGACLYFTVEAPANEVIKYVGLFEGPKSANEKNTEVTSPASNGDKLTTHC